jgi:2'-5' RNA ligase
MQHDYSDYDPMSFFSVAICPAGRPAEEVTYMKRVAERGLYWPFPGSNSPPHLTFFPVETTGLMRRYVTAIRAVCAGQSPFSIHFDRTEAFPNNGTLYLGPDEQSTERLTTFWEQLVRATRGNVTGSFRPHMSIARRGLTEAERRSASQFISEVDVKFYCTEICIRRLNDRRRQFDIVEKIPLGEMSIHAHRCQMGGIIH